MALFNYANREITAKIVYYGPGVCGKTTSLEYIHERIAPSQRGRLLSLATETDRTIFFDLLPLKLGEIGGFKIRFQLYTVPGQVKYNKTRKLVLQGADAIVFVADSQKSRREANIESFKNLQQNLQEQNRRLEGIPLVYEFNKRDLADILSIEDLNKDLNLANSPYFPTIATKGVGVMESLEAISKQALQDMEQRLTASSPVEEEEESEELTLSDDLMDLTGDEEIDFSNEDLGSLELESDLNEEFPQESLTEFSLETRPIGYDNDIPLEEFEIRDDEVAQTGTLKESEFFDLKDVEEQALRELDNFLEGKSDNEEAFLNFEDTEFSDLAITPAEEEQAFSTFTFDEEPGDDDALSPDEEQQFTSFTPGQNIIEKEKAVSAKENSVLEFSADMSLDDDASSEEFEAGGFLSPEEALQVEESLDFTLDTQASDADLTFSLEEEEPDSAESFAYDLEPAESETDFLSADLDLDNIALTTDEEDETLSEFVVEEEFTAKGQIETLDISESEMDLTFGEDEQGDLETENFPAFRLDDEAKSRESASYDVGNEELVSFTLDEEASETPGEDLEGAFGEENSIFGGSYGKKTFSQKTQETEFPDFRITDSVKFEMQVGEEISSGTPFEQQLEQLSSEDLFASDEEGHDDEFQPMTGEIVEEEQFQVISDEWTRFLVLAKYFYHRGENYRTQHTMSDNVLALMMYFTAVETALKAVASKYETCNPALASFHLLLESIEEETQKPVAGSKSIRNNILMMKNRIQLEGGYPDNEECELAARISERFLGSLAQDFLAIDFEKLSPVLPRPQTE